MRISKTLIASAVMVALGLSGQAFAQESPPEEEAPAAVNGDAASFIAPRPRPMGTPSPEAMERLRAAVSKPNTQAQAQRAAAPAPKPAPKPAERPRFGIGSLINRMSGAAAEAVPGRSQPPVTAYDDEQDMATDQDRMEIPAFLRRQAN